MEVGLSSDRMSCREILGGVQVSSENPPVPNYREKE